jgi:hypothetical protein
MYNTMVTGFSATINDLPPNDPIWIEVAATNGCAIGTYSESKLIGGPILPDTGFDPHESNNAWNISSDLDIFSLFLLQLI